MAACGCRAKTTQFVFCLVLSRGGPGKQASELPPKIKVDITLCAQTLDCVPHRDTFAPAQQQQKSGQNTLPYLARLYHMDVAQEEFCPNHRYSPLFLPFFVVRWMDLNFFHRLSLYLVSESINESNEYRVVFFFRRMFLLLSLFSQSIFFSLSLSAAGGRKQTNQNNSQNRVIDPASQPASQRNEPT